MILAFAALLILLACYGLYLVSAKQINKTKQGKLVKLTQHIRCVKISAIVFLILALYLYRMAYGASIAFVALCIFSSPLILAIIISVNDLKLKK